MPIFLALIFKSGKTGICNLSVWVENVVCRVGVSLPACIDGLLWRNA